jgi:hypothetical protein
MRWLIPYSERYLTVPISSPRCFFDISIQVQDVDALEIRNLLEIVIFLCQLGFTVIIVTRGSNWPGDPREAPPATGSAPGLSGCGRFLCNPDDRDSHNA